MAAGQRERPQARMTGAGENDHAVDRLREGKDGQERSDPVRAAPPASSAQGAQVGVVLEREGALKRPTQQSVFDAKAHSLRVSADGRIGEP